jgi:inner membrane protein
MNKPFLTKIVGIVALMIVMLIAVNYINHIITERQYYQNQVKRDIANSAADAQTIVGPIFVVPYTEEFTSLKEDISDKGVKTQKKVIERIESAQYFFPENLFLKGAFSNEYKSLGIYKALMYQMGGSIKGDFHIPANYAIKPRYKDSVITVKPAFLSIGISDIRGINGKPKLLLGNQSYKLLQGSNLDSLGKGIHANLGNLQTTNPQVIAFNLDLNLLGMEAFSFAPIATTNAITLKSSWQHPHFNGSFLPITKSISQKGFSGDWDVSSLSSTNQTVLMHMLKTDDNSSNINNFPLETLSVGFANPINVYSQADRATKYGLLFIGVTFLGFFLFETLKQLRIHPAQYTLVGLAMAMFYLLLVSFAEILGFALAYMAASAACVVLLGYYLSFVLKSKRNGIAFSVMLTALYGALYAILASEDNALIMGSILVFGLLALTMFITRKVDWYGINASSANPNAIK